MIEPTAAERFRGGTFNLLECDTMIHDTLADRISAVRKIEYRGRSVVTHAMIEQLHDLKPGTARQAFVRNREQFEEGIDFFDSPPSELDCDESSQSSSTAPHGGHRRDIRLYTEGGYLKLCKVFNDPLAWRIYGHMTAIYFAVRDAARRAEPVPTVPAPLASGPDILRAIEDQRRAIEDVKRMVEFRPASLAQRDELYPIRDTARQLWRWASTEQIGKVTSEVQRRLWTERKRKSVPIGPAENAERCVEARDFDLIVEAVKKFVGKAVDKQRTPLFRNLSRKRRPGRDQKPNG